VIFRCVKTTCLLILTVAQVPALEQILCGDKKGMKPWIYDICVSYHSSSSPSPFILVIVIVIIIVVIIITIITIIIIIIIIIITFLCIILSSPPSCFLSGHPVVLCSYPCASAVLVAQCSWNLAWATVTVLDVA